MKHIGIDIGGTFTDLVVYDDETKALSRSKAPSTPLVPEEAFLNLVEGLGLDDDELGQLLHATTIVTNLIVQRNGACVGLMTTRGFRDVLEIGRSYRPNLYDLQWQKPQPLVPRPFRLEIDERVGADGSVIKAADPVQIRNVASSLIANGVDAIAIAFINAFRNPSNEILARRVIEELDPNVAISISSEVDPKIREFERASTTVVNVYAKPSVSKYIEKLRSAGESHSPLRLMQSSGGMVPSWYASDFPVQLLYSGPAAGVIAGSLIGHTLGAENVCTMDMGGTSTDVCVIRGGNPETRDTVEPEWGMPVRARSFAINAIGAGGGSVIAVDTGGALTVGPTSLGAEPGPACYGRGGTLPSVTDANLLLGLLNPQGLLSGEIPLDSQRAREALDPIASELGASVHEVALGAYRIVNANMGQALRKITVGVGLDPRDFVLVPFGGAGGQHAAEVAREIGIRTVAFPRNASTLSALGLLGANVSSDSSKAVLRVLDDTLLKDLDGEFIELVQQVHEFLDERPGSVAPIVSRWAEMRYVGQAHELLVGIDDSPEESSLVRDAFEREHQRLYGVRLGDEIEVVNIGVTVSRVSEPLEIGRYVAETEQTEPLAHRQTLFQTETIPVYWRDGLPSGWQAEGPCLVDEVDSSIYIPAGDTIRCDEFGNLVLSLGA